MSRWVEIPVTIRVTRQRLWSNVFGTSPTAAGSWHSGFVFGPGCEWDVPGNAWVTMVDAKQWVTEPDAPDAKTVTVEVTVDDIVKALGELDPGTVTNIVEGKADCWDSDRVLQQIVYGEVIYG